MTTKISPPLTCPIPRGHPSHYRYEEDPWMSLVSSRINSWHRQRVRDLLRPRKAEYADLPEPSTFGKIFIRRDKKKKRKPLPVRYVISNSSSFPLLVYNTKREALAAMRRGHGKWPREFIDTDMFIIAKGMSGKRVEIPLGSYLWRADPEHNEFEDFGDNNQYPITTKRCPECPNKNSMQGTCGCSMFHNITHQGKPFAWTPPHEARHKRKQDLKPPAPKMDEESLLIYNIRIKSGK